MGDFLTTQKAADADPTIYYDPPISSVSAFCKAHHIARSFFYQLRSEGRAPRVMKLGRRTFVTREAAAEWRRRIEQETSQEIGKDERQSWHFPGRARGRHAETEGREG